MKYTYDDKFGYIEYFKNNEKQIIWLTKIENELFKCFYNNDKQTHEELGEAIYNTKEKALYMSALRQHIVKLNKKIKAIGRIANLRGIGYKFFER